VFERWSRSSQDKLKNAESLQGMRSMRKTEPFGSKQLCVGKNSFELCNTDRLHHRVLSARADNQTKKRETLKIIPPIPASSSPTERN
jgi:hypothetical protein